MTCLLQNYCTNGEGCDNHIGHNIERCSAFKRKPLTRFEHIQTCTMDELAETLFNIFGEGVTFGETHSKTKMFPNVDIIHEGTFIEWLKEEYHANQKH